MPGKLAPVHLFLKYGAHFCCCFLFFSSFQIQRPKNTLRLFHSRFVIVGLISVDLQLLTRLPTLAFPIFYHQNITFDIFLSNFIFTSSFSVLPKRQKIQVEMSQSMKCNRPNNEADECGLGAG